MSNPSAGPPPYSPSNDDEKSTHASAYPQVPQNPTEYPQPNMGETATPYPSYPHPQVHHVHVAQPQSFVYVADPGPRPANLTCPRCHTQVITQVRYTAGLLAWLLCAGCVIFGCIFGCCLIPFCVDDCQDAEHICPNCQAFLGQYKRL